MSIYETFVSIFGEYVPLSVESEVLVGETVQTVTTSAVNWGYIGAVAVFVLLFYSVLRIIGGIICAK